MKPRTVVLVVAFLVSIGIPEASAQAWRALDNRVTGVTSTPGFSVAPIVVSPVPVVVAPWPAYASGLSLAQTNPYVAPFPWHPLVSNPYAAPFPWYTILPPVSPYVFPGTAGGWSHDWDLNRRASAEDYGYRLDYTPRKRPAPDPTVLRPKNVDTRPDPRRARFEITVPSADAVILFDGVKTRQTGLERVFVTPPLDEDRIYSSTIEIQWTDSAGRNRSEKKSFEVYQGDKVRYSPKVNP